MSSGRAEATLDQLLGPVRVAEGQRHGQHAQEEVRDQRHTQRVRVLDEPALVGEHGAYGGGGWSVGACSALERPEASS